jgi:hypothetical protein
MSDENSAPELIGAVSGVVLTLMAHLRQSTLPSGEALESLQSRGTVASAWNEDGESSTEPETSTDPQRVVSFWFKITVRWNVN